MTDPAPIGGALAGERVFVIGATSGIGRAIADAAAGAGGDVLRGGRSAVAGPDSLHIDVGDDASCRDAFARTGPLDHLVFSVSSARTGEIGDASVTEARPYHDLQIWGAWRVIGAALPVLADGASITLITGTHARRPAALTPVVLAKNGLDTLAGALAVKLAPRRVNAVAPGPIETPLWEKLYRDEAERAAHLRAEAKRLPLGRVGRPADVARAVLFLMTSPFVTGAVLTVDGGDTLV